jgi:hypothetical protein
MSDNRFSRIHAFAGANALEPKTFSTIPIQDSSIVHGLLNGLRVVAGVVSVNSGALPVDAGFSVDYTVTGTANVTLTTPFSNNNYSVSVTPKTGSIAYPSPFQQLISTVHILSPSNFKVYFYRMDTALPSAPGPESADFFLTVIGA